MHEQNNVTFAAVVRWGVRITAILAVLIGAFWFGAWFTGYAVRYSLAGLITVKTNMALGQLLAGMALLLLGTERRNGVSQWIGMLFAMLVFLIGALTLSEHLFGWNLGIDQLLAKEPPGSAATLSPNRMGYPGSSSLALLGMGLLALAFKRRAIVPYLGIAVCVINLVPAVGFLYGIGTFYGSFLTGIAWPTIIAMMSLGVGLIVSRIDGGPMALILRDDAGGRLVRQMLPWVILVPLVLGYLRVQGELRGFYGTAAGTGALAIVMILVLSAMLWRSAAKLSRSDAAHREDEESLQRRTEELQAVMDSMRELEAHKRDFYRRTILAATGDRLEIVEPEDIQALQGELVRTWTLTTPDEYAAAREQSTELAKSWGLDADQLYGFMACAGEMLTNALKHAGGGEAYFYRTDNSIFFVVSDTGSGIDSINLPDVALVCGYSTAGTGGLGYKLIIACADKTYLATGPDGTTVAVEMRLPD